MMCNQVYVLHKVPPIWCEQERYTVSKGSLWAVAVASLSSHLDPAHIMLGCTVQIEYKWHFAGKWVPHTETGRAIQ